MAMVVMMMMMVMMIMVVIMMLLDLLSMYVVRRALHASVVPVHVVGERGADGQQSCRPGPSNRLRGACLNT